MSAKVIFKHRKVTVYWL